MTQQSETRCDQMHRGGIHNRMLQRIQATPLISAFSRSCVFPLLQPRALVSSTPQQPQQATASHPNLQAAASAEAEAVGIKTSGISADLLGR